ncbi:uncharacterized protein DUF2125 [Rhodobacter aestuarii]|uniref:DUF2125 domain-containing protein n=1 Tax=Rhodobacter aestuarii TaxID=453582 RepID=A0A1N7LGJ3_9RHOB|nr:MULTISPECIES: DUF2125 domain-containing protein [Rhodobacter]PTV95268.1 uncharacterized protein DUF2125 [Rhodobacter aestuarii]SIS72896.1 hypothetical protein SAMN05421580_10462 [Rhodobacter aestuarii]SOC08085.1 uncharacterized protein DUF2125 [Rhodobacter sp. JA431]
MTRLRTAGTTAFIALLLSSTALRADVTPEQVWESWQKQYSSYGFTVAPGSVDRSGDTLAIRDVVFTAADPDGSTTTVLNVPALLLEDQGDGTVKASVEGEITGTNSANVDGGTETAHIRIDKSEAIAVVSGTPEAMSYLIDAPSIMLAVSTESTVPSAGEPAEVSMQLTGLAGTQQVTADATAQTMKTDMKAAGMTMHLTGTDPEEGTTVVADVALTDLAILGTNVMPEGADAAEMGNAIGMGMSTDMKMGYGGVTYTMSAETSDGPVNISGSAQSGQATIALSRDGFRYMVSGDNTAVSVQTAQFPMPVSAQIARGEMDLALPLSATPDAQPVTAKLVIDGLSVSEQLWAMFDPQGHLGHGPATLVIDLSGKAKALMDLYSDEAAKSPVPPMQIDSLDVNKIQLTVAGADLSGKGALTFDNSMGMPMPLGAIDLQLSGANKLMDGLVAMGMMPQDQVMFAKMMMGVYATPQGEDMFSSKIEFKEGGRILANGQPIQ